MVKTMKITVQKSNDEVNNINDGIEDDDDVINTAIDRRVVACYLAVILTTRGETSIRSTSTPFGCQLYVLVLRQSEAGKKIHIYINGEDNSLWGIFVLRTTAAPRKNSLSLYGPTDRGFTKTKMAHHPHFLAVNGHPPG
jgi:hypothetical protein